MSDQSVTQKISEKTKQMEKIINQIAGKENKIDKIKEEIYILNNSLAVIESEMIEMLKEKAKQRNRKRR